MGSENDDILDVEGASAYLKISKYSLYQLTRANKIPCHRPTGRKLIFSRRELMEFVIKGKESNE